MKNGSDGYILKCYYGSGMLNGICPYVFYDATVDTVAETSHCSRVVEKCVFINSQKLYFD